MPIAPSGAVISIANTATESTICPQAKPIAIGTEPIAANTGYGNTSCFCRLFKNLH